MPIKQGGRGKQFESLIIYSFNSSESSYAVRLREGVKGVFCKCKNYINLSHMSRQQPFDYVVIHKSRPFALEAKSVHGSSFPFRNIKDHQIFELQRFEMHGSAHVLIEFIPKKRTGRRYFLVPISVFKDLIDFYSSEDNRRESIPMSKLEAYVNDNKIYEVQLGKNQKGKPILMLGDILDKILEATWSN